MLTVGTLEAKTQLSALIDRVMAGEEVMITRHGQPVARLVSATPGAPEDARARVERFREIRKGMILDGLSVRELIDEGRL
jgi:prevent-host-death family protein